MRHNATAAMELNRGTSSSEMADARWLVRGCCVNPRHAWVWDTLPLPIPPRPRPRRVSRWSWPLGSKDIGNNASATLLFLPTPSLLK